MHPGWSVDSWFLFFKWIRIPNFGRTKMLRCADSLCKTRIFIFHRMWHYLKKSTILWVIWFQINQFPKLLLTNSKIKTWNLFFTEKVRGKKTKRYSNFRYQKRLEKIAPVASFFYSRIVPPSLKKRCPGVHKKILTKIPTIGVLRKMIKKMIKQTIKLGLKVAASHNQLWQCSRIPISWLVRLVGMFNLFKNAL